MSKIIKYSKNVCYALAVFFVAFFWFVVIVNVASGELHRLDLDRFYEHLRYLWPGEHSILITILFCSGFFVAYYFSFHVEMKAQDVARLALQVGACIVYFLIVLTVFWLSFESRFAEVRIEESFTSRSVSFESGSGEHQEVRFKSHSQENLILEENEELQEQIMQDIMSGKCHAAWEELWKYIQLGDQSAMSMTTVLLAPPIGLPFPRLLLPGNTGDQITTFRDFAVFAIESYDPEAQRPDGEEKGFLDLSTMPMFEGFGLGKYGGGEDVMNCMKNYESGCKEIADRHGIIPYFEDYVEEMNAKMKSGLKARCIK